jgi:hypothetical protein
VLKVVKAADGKELKLKTLRGGSERSLNITPAERPQSQRLPRREASALRDWVRRVQPQAQGEFTLRNPNLQFDLVRPNPGLVLNTETATVAMRSPEIPEGLTITVTREGKKPAKISVKQKERDIETTEDKVNELPDDVRRHVLPMLGRPQRAALNLRRGGIAPGPVPGAPPRPFAPPQPGAPARPPQVGADVVFPAPLVQEGRVRVRSLENDPLAGGVERRIQDLERRLEELQRSIRGRDEDKGERK